MSSDSSTGGQAGVDRPVGPAGEAAPSAGGGGEAGEGPPTFEPDVPREGRRPRGRRVAAVLGSPRVAWGVAVVSLVAALAAAGWAGTVWRQQQQEAVVLERAEAVAEQVTSFRGARIDQWVSETQELATGDYAEQVAGLFDQQLRQSLRENQVESTGRIDNAYLQQLDGDEATVFIVARQFSTNAQRQQPVEDKLRLEITMRRVDGEWLASNVAVLGPAPAAPTGPGAGQPSEEGSP